MRGLTAGDLLSLRDRCRGLSAPDAALELLGLSDPAAIPAELADLTIGRLGRWLLLLRAATVGQRIDLYIDCPACGETLELSHDLADLLVEDPDPAEVAALPPLEVDGRPMYVRPATLADLVEAAAAIDADTARRIIAARCLTPTDGTDPLAADDLCEPIPDAVAERLATLDPQADLELGLDCPACRHAWQTPLDVMGTVRRELDLRTAHVLAEVHELALAYHWSEAEILALSASRRQDYLALVRA